MKKFVLFIFSLIIGLSMFCLCIHANGISIEMIDGASIRTGGTYQGLKFQASANSNFNVSIEHGFYITTGVHSYDEMISAINSKSSYVGSNKLIKKSTTGTDKDFAVTIYDIPKEEYGNTITAIAYYVSSNVNYFSSICVSRDIADVAKNAYKNGLNDDFILDIVENSRVKVIDTNLKTTYYKDLDEVVLKNGDDIYLDDYTYKAININKNDVSIYGLNKGISGISNRSEESIINGCIDINSGVSNVLIDGVKINGTQAIRINGNSDNVSIVNNVLNYDNLGISDNNTASCQNNLMVKDNLFNASNTSYSKAINILGYVGDSLNISDNKFISNTSVLNENDFEIKIDKFKNDTYVNIKSNEFNSYGANYIIDLGYSMGLNGSIVEDNTYYVNIENNKMCEDGKLLHGNGIRLSYLSSNASVIISHNYNLRASTFYNHLLLSTGLSAKSTLEEYPSIKIIYNEMSVDPLPGASGNVIEKPDARSSTPSKAYVRIGLGLPAEDSGENSDYHVDISNNYFADSTSRYAYEDITSSSYDKNTNQVVLGTNAYNNISDCDDGYNAYIASYVEFEDAIVYAISNNIIKEGYENKLAYTNGSIKSIGDFNFLEKIILKSYGIDDVENIRDYYKELVLEAAYDYYYQGTQIQYDQYNSRRNVNSSPDDATEYRGIYLDCSSYVNSIYNYVFGTNVTNYATQSTANFEAYSKNGGRDGDVVYYCDTTVSRTSEEKNNILNEVKGLLEVGDLINYRHGGSSTGGHVMIYVGNDYFLHCTGSSLTSGTKTDGSFDPSTITSDGTTSAEKSGGAIQLLKASELFSNTSSKRYLFYTDQTSFSVIRPLNRNLSPTLKACNKAFMKGLTFEKTASTAHMSSVNRNEEITYTITIKNNSNEDVNNVYVSDIISSYCTYKSGSINNNGIVDGLNVRWNNISVKASSRISLSYKVIVKNDVEFGTIIESNNTKVNNVSMNKMYHIVSEYSDSELNSLVSKAKTYIGNTTYTDDFKLFDDIYYSQFGKHLDSSIRTSEDAINALIDLTNKTKYDNTELSDMLVCDLYGGLAIKDEMVSNNDRIRLIKDSYLEAGDIIILYNKKTSTYKAYMYLGANEDKLISIDNGTVSVVYSGTNLDTFLIQVFAYSRFGVIRPSLSMWNN